MKDEYTTLTNWIIVMPDSTHHIKEIKDSQLFFESKIENLNNRFFIFTQDGDEVQVFDAKIFISTHNETMSEVANFIISAINTIDIHCHPLECPTIQEANQRLHSNSNGFLSILGATYGDINPSRRISRQHHEYIIARDKWKHLRKYVAVFLPNQSSQFFQDLLQRTQEMMNAKWKTPEQIKEDFDRLYRFIQEIIQDGAALEWNNLVQTYKDPNELFVVVQQTCLKWIKGMPHQVHYEVKVTGQLSNYIPDSILGRIHIDIFEALESILKKVYLKRNQVNLLCLVHGSEGSTYNELIEALVSDDELLKGRAIGRAKMVIPENCTLTLFTDAFKSLLGFQSEENDPSVLAAKAYMILREQSVNFLINGIDRYIGGTSQFHRDFWQPFINQLFELHESSPLPPKNKLIGILISNTELTEDPDNITYSRDMFSRIDDYTKILLLPRVDDIREEQILEWIEDNQDDLPITDDRLIDQIIFHALHRIISSSNEIYIDPIPQHVFERLRLATTWQENLNSYDN